MVGLTRFVVYADRVDVLGLRRRMTAREAALVWLALHPRATLARLAATIRTVEQVRAAYEPHERVMSGADYLAARLRAAGDDEALRAALVTSILHDAEYPAARPAKKRASKKRE